MLGERSGGGRRDGGLKMGWTKRSGVCRQLWVSIAGSISDQDLKRPEVISVCDAAVCRAASGELSWCWGDEIGDWKNLRNDPHGNTASIAWPGQACPESFALYLMTVLFIRRYP
jgi:hypothetical protein